MQKIGFQTTKTNETPAKNWNMPFDVVVILDMAIKIFWICKTDFWDIVSLRALGMDQISKIDS